MTNLPQRKLARVLFDEFHSESWSVSATRAREMQPEDPANASYQNAAEELVRRDFIVQRNIDAPLTATTLAGADVLVFAHPCDPRWEHTTSQNPPALSAEETRDVLEWVRAGGGLLVITEYEHDKYGDNLNELLAAAGLRIENGKVFDRSACAHENPEWIVAAPAADSALGHAAERACFYRASWCVVEGDAALAWCATANAHPAHAGVIGAGSLGAGRVVVVTDSVLFGDERLGAFDHRQLWLNVAYWLAAPAFQKAKVEQTNGSAIDSAAWREIKSAVNELRVFQQPNGGVESSAHEAAAACVARITGALESIRPILSHQSQYLATLASDLAAWKSSAFAKPDFAFQSCRRSSSVGPSIPRSKTSLLP